MKTFGIELCMIISSIIVLSGCGGTVTERVETELKPGTSEVVSPSPSYGDTLIESYIGDLITLNPLISNEGVSELFYSRIFNGLVRYDENFRIVPDLADTWEISPDGLLLTFGLKRNVQWHDGVSFTSADVKFTFEKIMDPATGCPALESFGSFATVETPDDYTVRFRLKEQFAPALIYCGFYVIPRHIYQNEDIRTSKYNRNPIGTGQFRFVEWRSNEQIVMKANNGSFAGRPYINRYICKIIPDKGMAFLAFKRGEIDCYSLTWDQYAKQMDPQFLEKYNIYKVSIFFYYMPYNTQKPFLSDKNVRRALTMAIDRENLIKEVLRGFGKPASGPFVPGSWPCNQGIVPLQYSPEKARELLSAAGFCDSNADGYLDRDGKTLEIEILKVGKNPEAMILPKLIEEYWRKIGVKAKLSFVDWKTQMSRVSAGDFDAEISGRALGSWDPDIEYSAWHSSQIPDSSGRAGYNYPRYSNPEMDSLLDQGRKTYDFEERKKIYNRVHELIYEDQPCTFFYISDKLLAVDKRFYGISVTDSGTLTPIQYWYVPEGLQKYQ
ncbi:MAG: peptide-binding protein [Candidatus Wallbacteria bacterium]|nr:peptide-binding protein [Candidatus Wallbacteria bacterium]